MITFFPVHGIQQEDQLAQIFVYMAYFKNRIDDKARLRRSKIRSVQRIQLSSPRPTISNLPFFDTKGMICAYAVFMINNF
ncbi:MAG: hypothetical protein D3923_12195 [Candidatus Electrothrix sp. AR3]|nr:hypothetical protein [Candidatus Electrothrix sp. AR3]